MLITGRIIDIFYECNHTAMIGEIVLFLRRLDRSVAKIRYAWPSYMYVRHDTPLPYNSLILRTETIMAKGFDDGFQIEPSKFIKVYCRNQSNLFALKRKIRGQLYEADIDPCIRFIHDHDLNPSGVIEAEVSLKSNEEYRGVVGKITNRPDLNVPFLIASFDIECTSRTGDFPLAVKPFADFATSLFDFCDRRAIKSLQQFKTLMDVLQHPSYAPLAIRGQGRLDETYLRTVVEPAIQHTINRSYLYTYDGLMEVAKMIVVSDLPVIDFAMPLFSRRLTSEEVEELWNYRTLRSPPHIEGDTICHIGTVLQWSDMDTPEEKTIFTLGSISGYDNNDLISLEKERTRSGSGTQSETLYELNDNAVVKIYAFRTDYPEVDKVVDQIATLRQKYRDETYEQCRNYVRSHILEKADIVIGRQCAAKTTIVDMILAEVNKNAPKNVTYCWGGERDMLLAWRNYVNVRDPDIITGYNIFSFDYRYIFDRAAELGIQSIGKMSRLPYFQKELTATRLSSSALGDNEMWIPAMPGRVAIDMYKFVQKEYSLESYKLDEVALHFLNKQKADLPPQEIFRRQYGTDDDRRSIAMYCVLDCILPIQLMRKLDVLQKNCSMSHVCRVPLSFLFVRGQGVKVYSLVVHYAHTVFPNDLILVNTRKDTNVQDGKYKGAIVFEPVCGLHLDPTAVGDFNSLYPNSMIARNISHDMILDRGVWKGRENELRALGYELYTVEYLMDDDTKRECTFVQVNSQCRPGLLPEILKTLLAARKNVREQMKTEKDPFHRNVLDTLQWAYKITANSLYGQTGASTSHICRKEIAACTTAIGRSMLLTARNVFEGLVGQILDITDRHGNPAKVYVGAAETRAGDTDSCMTCWTCQWVVGPKEIMPILDDRDKIWVSMQVCKIACDKVNAIVPPPEHIAFEKVICPFAIFAKKRYHGHYYLEDAFSKDPDNPVYITKSMGIVLKRRDNAPILKDIYGMCMDELMSKKTAIEVLQRMRDELLSLDKHPMEDFVITKTLRNDYKRPTSIAHKVLADRQAERDPGNRFDSNDRVPYVYFKSKNHTKKTLQGDRIETPEFVQANGLKIDYAFYIEHQLMKPLAQIFVDMLGMTNQFTTIIKEAIAKYM